MDVDDRETVAPNDEPASAAPRRPWHSPTFVRHDIEAVTATNFNGGGSDGMFFS